MSYAMKEDTFSWLILHKTGFHKDMIKTGHLPNTDERTKGGWQETYGNIKLAAYLVGTGHSLQIISYILHGL